MWVSSWLYEGGEDMNCSKTCWWLYWSFMPIKVGGNPLYNFLLIVAELHIKTTRPGLGSEDVHRASLPRNDSTEFPRLTIVTDPRLSNGSGSSLHQLITHLVLWVSQPIKPVTCSKKVSHRCQSIDRMSKVNKGSKVVRIFCSGRKKRPAGRLSTNSLNASYVLACDATFSCS